MKDIIKIINKILNKKNKIKEKSSFLDYTDKEKLEMMDKAAKEANKMQRDLVNKYEKIAIKS